MNRVNIRVYKRGYKGTILIWNTEPLTEEQRAKVQVVVRTDGDWFKPELGAPDTVRMGKIMDGHTDTVMVVHNDALTADTPFSVKLVFGDGPTAKEATLDIEPKNQHKAYVKTERYQLTNGQFVYADPAFIIGAHPVVMEEIQKMITEAVTRALGGK
jgi:hypothetical protein